MGDKDFIKPELERRGTVHFGKVLVVLFFLYFLHDITSAPNGGALVGSCELCEAAEYIVK